METHAQEKSNKRNTRIDSAYIKQVLERVLETRQLDRIDASVLKQLQALILKRKKRREYSKLNQRLNRMRKKLRQGDVNQSSCTADAANQNVAQLLQEGTQSSLASPSQSVSTGAKIDQAIQEALELAIDDGNKEHLKIWMLEKLHEFVQALSRRQQSCKDYQQTHRGRCQTEENQLLVLNDEIRERIRKALQEKERLQLMLCEAMPDCRTGQIRIMDAYAQLFRCGSTSTKMQLQESFFQQNFEEHFKYSGGDRPLTREGLLFQWQIASALFPRLQACVRSIKAVAENFIHMELHMELPIVRKTIEVLYPHLLQNEDLVQQVLTKTLRHPLLLSVWFSPSNKLESMEVEYDLVSSWNRVLQSVSKTEQVMTGGKLVNGKFNLPDHTTQALLE